MQPTSLLGGSITENGDLQCHYKNRNMNESHYISDIVQYVTDKFSEASKLKPTNFPANADMVKLIC